MTVRDKYNLSKRFPTFFLTALRDRFVHRNLDSPASQQHLVNHQSSLVILAGLELEKRKGDGNKKKKKSSLTLQGSKRRDINATSPHTSSFVFGASFQLRVAIFYYFFLDFGVKFFFFHLVVRQPCLLKQELSRVAFHGEISGRNHISIQLIVGTARCQFSCNTVNCNKFT